MPRTRIEAASAVAACLDEMEVGLDRLLASSARLNGVLPEARLKARVPISLGQEAIETAAEAHAALVRVRRQMAATRTLLAQARTDLGIERAIGDLRPCPELGASLRLVEPDAPDVAA